MFGLGRKKHPIPAPQAVSKEDVLKRAVDGRTIPLDMPIGLLMPCIECPLIKLLGKGSPIEAGSPEVEEAIRIIKGRRPIES